MTLGCVALFFLPQAKEDFRLPKLMLGSCLAAASLVFLVREVPWGQRAFWRRPVVLALAPLVAAALLSWVTTRHPLQVREGMLDLAVGALCLVVWSKTFSAERLRRALDVMMVPAALLAVLGVLQYHDLWEPMGFAQFSSTDRLGITSTAGNPLDLAAYLLLPCLAAQVALVRWRRLWPLWAVLLALFAYGIFVSQSITAVVSLVVAVPVLWSFLVPRRRFWTLLGGLAGLGLVAVLVAAPLRHRVVEKVAQLGRGELNRVLTGRLDGWRAAWWMFGHDPLLGVGHGAFRPSFAPARIALVDRGVEFFPGQQAPVFGNAHNELLELAADCGLAGLAALAWGLWVLARELEKRGTPGSLAASTPLAERAEQGLAVAGVVALGVSSLTFFPFRIAIAAFPALAFLAWVFRRGEGEPSGERAGERKHGLVALGATAVSILMLSLLVVRFHHRISANILLERAELRTKEMLASGTRNEPLLRSILPVLATAERRDPIEVGIPIAIGSVHLLLKEPREALVAYDRALALEPRPEIYENRVRAFLALGDRDAATKSLETALKLDRELEKRLKRSAAQQPQP